jgi:lipopolysaccharide export system protein LptC
MRIAGSHSTLLPLLILAMLAGFTLWLERATRDETRGPDPKLRHDPDFWVEDFIVRRFNIDGSIQHTLNASRMLHYPDDETTEVSEPRIAYFREGRTATITALNAWLDKDGEHLRLTGDVRVIHADARGTSTAIDTAELNILPDEEQAFTAVPVTITQGRSVLTGTGGMELNNKTRITVLKGPVTGTIYNREQIR